MSIPTGKGGERAQSADQFEPKTVFARGRRISFLERGHGSRVVALLHGNPSDPWVYERLLRALPPDDFRAIAVDWYQGSDPPWGGYNVSGFADQLRDLLSEVGVVNATVGGHSLGGIAAQVFALRYPERVDNLMLFATGATSARHGRLPSMIKALEQQGAAALRDVMAGSYATPPPSTVLDAHVFRASKSDPAVFIEAMRSASSFDLTSVLPYISARTLVLHGRSDDGRLPGHATTLATGIPNAKLVELGCGHNVMEEAPDEFVAAVLDFLR